MSTASSPRSVRGSSPANDASPAILTPKRKIQALLAAVGSDSEPEENTNASRKAPQNPIRNASLHDEERVEQSDDAEDDLPRPPKGRLAARMQAQNVENEPSAGEKGTAFERVKKSLNERKVEQPARVASPSLSPSEDEAPVERRQRRLFKRQENEPANHRGGSDRDRSESPLFCSPYKPQEKQPDATAISRDSDDEEEEEVQQPKNARFLALVEKKRKEREAKEKEEAEKKRRRAEIAKTINDEDMSDASDEDLGGRKLTQNSKPTRKASKKALDAMNQETQRISRNMQLAHQAKTKKKITKESFFSKFNFMQNSKGNSDVPATSSTGGSSQPASGPEDHATPPTSPLLGPEDSTKAATAHPQLSNLQPADNEAVDLDDEPLMSLEEVLAKPVPSKQAETSHEPSKERASTVATSPSATRKAPFRVRVSRKAIADNQKDNSDSDLEVITSPGKCRRIAAFENLPAKKSQDSNSLLKLRALAHLYSPSKRRQSSMTASELQTSLRKQARLQAVKERGEKIQELKDKGIYVDTAEERARVEEDVEDLMEKARMEGEEISKREKQAAKKEGKDEPNAFDDEDDDDYVDGDGEDEDEVELSGSDDDEGGDENDLVNDENADAKPQDQQVHLIEDQAEDAEESDEDPIEDSDMDNETHESAKASTRRRKRGLRVISDDEDEGPEAASEEELNQHSQPTNKPQFPALQTAEEPSLGLTQAFAATLGDSQGDAEQDSLAVLRQMPDPGLMGSELLEPDSQEIVKDSQERPSEPIDLFASYTQSSSRVAQSPGGPQIFTQYSEIPEPTQDAGFVLSPFDQAKRFQDAPPSTEETVLLQGNDSPMMRKRGKLLRRGPGSGAADEENGFTIKSSAFDVLRKKAKKVPEVFDKTKSDAKEIVDEAAEESEDEYAGLGGASDDGGDEEDEYDISMINDNSGEKVDEKELAALNANHVREQDEKQVSKLLKDITTGALRRKRGAADDLDLSDSDDERLAARRRAKRQEFNKMRKALLADEKIGQIAENPKKLAFLRAIEDREPEDDIGMDFLQEGGSQDEASKEEPASQGTEDANSEETGGKNKRKRPLKPSSADTTNRAPASHRRTIASKKPATLAEIRESVSFLLEGPNAGESKQALVLSDSEEESDVENNDANGDEAQGRQHGRKRRKASHKVPIPFHEREGAEDRLALNSAAAANSTTNTGSSKMAFHTVNSGDDPDAGLGRKPSFRFNPALSAARIAQNNAAAISANGGNANLRTVGRSGVGGEKKKGAVNYYTAAREKQRARELKMKGKGESSNIKNLLGAKKGGLSALVRGGQWE